MALGVNDGNTLVFGDEFVLSMVDNISDGTIDITLLGTDNGKETDDGSALGINDGNTLVSGDGGALGILNGALFGLPDCIPHGTADRALDGNLLGAVDGACLGGKLSVIAGCLLG